MTAPKPGRRRGRISVTDDEFVTGTALSALPHDAPPPSTLRLEDLTHNPHNRRDTYDTESVREMAATMREVGQLQPVAVVHREVYLAHHPDTDIGTAPWVVLIGNRRLAAAHLAGLERLDVTVADRLGGEDPHLSEAMLVENLHRESLPPLLEARELHALVERHGSQAAVAKRIGKTPAWVSQRLALLNLTPELRDRFEGGDLSVKEARTAGAVPPERQQQRLDELRGIRRDPPPEASASTNGAGGEPAAPPARRPGRPRKAPDLDEIARKLYQQLQPADIERLIAILSRGNPG